MDAEASAAPQGAALFVLDCMGAEFTPEKKERFLKALRQMPNVARAARMAKIDRRTAYKHRESDQKFAAAWDEALGEGVELLEESVWKQAKKGNSTLAIFLLKAHKPEMYRDDFDHHHDGEVTIKVIRADANSHRPTE